MKLQAMFKLYYILFLVCPQWAGAQADTYIKLLPYSHWQHNPLAASANPAALADAHEFSAGIYGERRYLLKELGNYRFALALPAAGSCFGVLGAYEGGGPRQSGMVALAYARSLGRAQAGLQFGYHSTSTRSYGRYSFISASAALLLPLSPGLRAGIHLMHSAGPPGKQPAAVFSAGLGYDASRQFFMGLLISKTEDRMVQVQAGFEYKPVSQLSVRAGIDAATALFYFGVGIVLQQFRVELSAALHPQLGASPGTAFLYPSTFKE